MWNNIELNIELNHFWQNSNIELNQFGYRSPLNNEVILFISIALLLRHCYICDFQQCVNEKRCHHQCVINIRNVSPIFIDVKFSPWSQSQLITNAVEWLKNKPNIAGGWFFSLFRLTPPNQVLKMFFSFRSLKARKIFFRWHFLSKEFLYLLISQAGL